MRQSCVAIIGILTHGMCYRRGGGCSVSASAVSGATPADTGVMCAKNGAVHLVRCRA